MSIKLRNQVRTASTDFYQKMRVAVVKTFFEIFKTIYGVITKFLLTIYSSFDYTKNSGTIEVTT